MILVTAFEISFTIHRVLPQSFSFSSRFGSITILFLVVPEFINAVFVGFPFFLSVFHLCYQQIILGAVGADAPVQAFFICDFYSRIRI